MKTCCSIMIFLLMTSFNYGQNSTSKIKLYNARIKCYDNGQLVKGVFYGFNDSTLFIINAESMQDVINHDYLLTAFPVSSIKWLKIRRKGQVGTYFILGALAGGTTGAAIGLISGDDPADQSLLHFSADEKAAMLGAPLFVLGGVLGAAFGSQSKIFEIHRSPEQIRLNAEILNKYAIIKYPQPTAVIP